MTNKISAAQKTKTGQSEEEGQWQILDWKSIGTVPLKAGQLGCM